MVLLLAAASCPAQPSNAPPGVNYSAFKLITERNIFNPRRRAQNVRAVEQPAATVDSFTLVGTMSYEKGPFAFFEGSDAGLRKVAKVSDAIAGYKVTDIAYNSVKLVAETNEVQLAVGMQMRREDNGPWQVVNAREYAPAGAGKGTNSTASVTASGDDPPSSASAPAGADDPVMRRLMQRREQENNR
jgi:hypothetical protein